MTFLDICEILLCIVSFYLIVFVSFILYTHCSMIFIYCAIILWQIWSMQKSWDCKPCCVQVLCTFYCRWLFVDKHRDFSNLFENLHCCLLYVYLIKHNAYTSLIRDWFSYFCGGGGGRGLENIGFLVHCLLWQLVWVGNKSNGMCLSNVAVLCMTL